MSSDGLMKTKEKLTKKELEELHEIDNILQEAKKWQLEWEVINSAVQYLKENRQANVTEAFRYGYYEWIK